MGNLQSIVYLSEEEYKTLITNQTITKNGRTLTYNENSLYITPETGQDFYETIAKTVFTLPSSVSATPTQEGGVNPTTGNNMSGTQYYRTGYRNFTNNMLFKLNHNDYKYTMWLYSDNNIESKICSLTNQDWFSGLTLIPNDKGGLYFRICYTRKDGAALTTTDVETITANAFLFEAIVPSNWHQAVFYGLATAAGDNTQSASSNVVGTYTDEAKAAIQQMFDVPSTDDIPNVPVQDVQVNGSSILNNGIANFPYAEYSTAGVIKPRYGVSVNSNGELSTYQAATSEIKSGNGNYNPITPTRQYMATFYGLAQAAGDTTQSVSDNAVGTYTEDAKSAINQMLGSAVQVDGTTPTLTAKPGVRYVCGTITSLTFTPSTSGICDVCFNSGSTVTVLTVPSTVLWPDWFDPTALEANTTYELNVMDGIYGAVATWS